MIIGEVTPSKEAVVRLTVQDGQGQAQESRAVIDTGFTEHLTLPSHLIDIWQLPFVQFIRRERENLHPPWWMMKATCMV